MKSPQYVSIVTSLYRKYIDNLSQNVSANDKKDLLQIFNRGGFSQAYLFEKTGKDVMCYEKPKNWGLLVGKVLKVLGKGQLLISNEENIDLILGDGIEIWNGDYESPSSIISYLDKTSKGYVIGNIRGKIKEGDKVYRTSSKVLNESVSNAYNYRLLKKKKISVVLELKSGKNAKVYFDDYTFESDIQVEEAKKSPLSKEQIEAQFSKTGDTPFAIGTLEINMDNNIFIPVSKINEIRREALKKYEEFLNSKNRKEVLEKGYEFAKTTRDEPAKKEISILISEPNRVDISIIYADNYYFNFKDIYKNFSLVDSVKGKKIVVLPNITKSNYERLIKSNAEEIYKHFDGVVISNIGQIEFFKDKPKGFSFIANYTMNVFNTETIKLLKSLSFDKVILSVELTKAQINDLYSTLQDSDIKMEVLSYGRVCVMTSEYCPVGSVAGGFSKSKKCSMPCMQNKKYYLKDRMGVNFRVIPDNIDCQSRIYNSKINSIDASKVNADSIRLDFLEESEEDINSVIEMFKNGTCPTGEEYTKGHFERPV